jgi:hypothetical protein
LYVLVDEYDNSVMKLATTNPEAGQKLRDGSNSPIAPIPSQFTRFWSAVKNAQSQLPKLRLAATGITPVTLTEFAGSGGNHLMPIEFDPPFVGLYGLTGEEVRRAITFISPPLPPNLQLDLFNHIDKQMNGYRVDSCDKEGLFNPARVMYCLSNIQARRTKVATQPLQDLLDFQDDTQTQPAQSSLAVVVSSPESRLLISRLLGAGEEGVECEGGLHRGFTLSSMHTSPRDLMSYL